MRKLKWRRALARAMLSAAIAAASPLWAAPASSARPSLDGMRAPSEGVKRALGPRHPDYAKSLVQLGQAYGFANDPADVASAYSRALEIQEKVLGPEHADTRFTRMLLAETYLNTGDLARARPLYETMLAYAEKTDGKQGIVPAGIRGTLADIAQRQGRFADAERGFRQALAALQAASTLRPGDAWVPGILRFQASLAQVLKSEGRFGEADAICREALALAGKTSLGNTPAVAGVLRLLAALADERGLYHEALPLYERVLAMDEKAFGPDARELVPELTRLAAIRRRLGETANALALAERALAIADVKIPEGDPVLADALDAMGEAEQDRGRLPQAETLFLDALAARAKAYGPKSPAQCASLMHLAALRHARHNDEAAAADYRRALGLLRAAGAPAGAEAAAVLAELGRLYAAAGRMGDADSALRQSLAIRERVLGHDHPDVAATLADLAGIELRQGRGAAAVAHAADAYAILARRIDADGFAAGGGAGPREYRAVLATVVEVMARVNSADDLDRAFIAAQLARHSSVGQNVAQMAARFAAREDDLARAVRAHQDSVDELAVAQADLDAFLGRAAEPEFRKWRERLTAQGAGGGVRLAIELQAVADSSSNMAADYARQAGPLRERVAGLESRVGAESRAMAERFPEYAALTSTAPASVEQTRSLIADDEALLLYLADARGVYAWAVTRKNAAFMRIDMSAAQLAAAVTHLRTRLDPESNPALLRFDAEAAHALYRKLFAPLESTLGAARHILVVADGALASLPFAVLVSRNAGAGGAPDYLADRYAFSSLPAVNSLRALRRFAQRRVGDEPFLGLGNPKLAGGTSGARGIAMRAVYSRAPGGGAGGGTAAIADVEFLRKQDPLPETADELKALAAALSAPPESVRVQDRATETFVKSADLTHYRVIAFATHGVMAGELGGLAEPGLILTPPAVGSPADDGYLSASEVAQLRLSADWVLLSACNTAAGDGSPGAEGLSGLAKAFFHAGARSLLVSNWYVPSEAAAQLTAQMLKNYASQPALGKAAALRVAMNQLRADPKFAHPMFWAPFVIVGEGGATARSAP